MSYRDFLRRNLNKKNQIRLKNRDFTIICNNCVGGVIYHELNQKFCSPTINLFFPKASQYVKFCANLEYYLNADIYEKRAECDYPIGMLDDDIEIHFMHYDSFEEAVRIWHKRCERVDFNNLYFIFIQKAGCTEKDINDFLELSYKNKIVFTSDNHEDTKNTIFLPGTEENGHVMDLCRYKSKFTGVRYIDDFDYVSFLNS